MPQDKSAIIYHKLIVTSIRLFYKRKGAQLINIIVHYPETPEKQALFDARVAKFHSEYVAQYIEKLNCPTEQKLKLIDAIAQTILENGARESSK